MFSGNQNDPGYLRRRLHQETAAAEGCNDPKAAAAHVELARRYLEQLNARSAK